MPPPPAPLLPLPQPAACGRCSTCDVHRSSNLSQIYFLGRAGTPGNQLACAQLTRVLFVNNLPRASKRALQCCFFSVACTLSTALPVPASLPLPITRRHPTPAAVARTPTRALRFHSRNNSYGSRIGILALTTSGFRLRTRVSWLLTNAPARS